MTTIQQVRASDLLAARTADEVEAIISALGTMATWKPLGGKPNNMGQVSVMRDSGDALVERITNAIDAVIERRAAAEGGAEYRSPREAAGSLFGVQGGYVSSLNDAQRRDLAQNVVVTLQESGVEKHPTVVVQDAGVGQHPDDFEDTLVSLNEENKREKLYLMGAYGWGGAASFAFCKYGIFVSRRAPELSSEVLGDQVGWTIVRYNELREQPWAKHGVYEYLCVRGTGDEVAIPRFDPAELPNLLSGWSGTRCTLVEYDLSRYSEPAWRPRNSVWLLFNALLFDPVLPFLIRDERAKAIKGNEKSSLGGLVIEGTAAKLRLNVSRDKEKSRISYHDSWHGNFPDGGAVVINYYVIQAKDDAKADWDPTNTYVTPDQAVTVTHNGQRQGTFPRTIFDKMGLVTLSRYLIVHVDVDSLTWQAKRDLFTSTRDRLKDSPVSRLLLEKVFEALTSDTELDRLDRERKDAIMSRRSKRHADRIKRLLEKAIEGVRQGTEVSYRKVRSANQELPLYKDQALVEQESPTTNSDDETPGVAVYEGEPTMLRVLNPKVRIPAGRKAVVRLHLDAADGYIGTNASVDALPRPALQGVVTRGAEVINMLGHSELRGGILRCTVSAERASVGDRGRIVFTVVRPGLLPLMDEAEVEVVEPPVARVKPAGKHLGTQPGPEVKEVHRDEWSVLGFDEHKVAKLEENAPKPGMLTIWVNWDYPPLDAKLNGEKKITEEEVEGYKAKFCASMALLAWLQSDLVQHEPLPQEQKDAELSRGAQMFIFTQFVKERDR